jgi:hypothetical protein
MHKFGSIVSDNLNFEFSRENVAANQDDWDFSHEGHGQDNICVCSLPFSYITNHLSG